MSQRPFVINEVPGLVGEVLFPSVKKRSRLFHHPADGLILTGLVMLATTLLYWAARGFLYTPTLSVSATILTVSGLLRAFIK